MASERGRVDQKPSFDTLADDEVLELAAKDGSILVTMNSADFPPILRKWAAAGRSHAGVIILHGIRPADFDIAVAAVATILQERPAQDDWTDRAVVAPGA
jgi:Domain of unknown function (DUF5615)